jgi:hypothetical protein
MSEMNDDDAEELALGEKLARMEVLFNEAIDTNVSTHAIDFLPRAHLLLEIADQDTTAAGEAIHTTGGREAAKREWDALAHDEQVAIVQEVTSHWALCTTHAVKRLWHAAEVLGFEPESIDPKHVALTASTYLSKHPHELEQATK